MSNNKIRQQRTPGAIFRIQLPCNKFSFGRILGKANYAFYDLVSDDGEEDLKKIISSKVLFIISVYNGIITTGRWIKIGKLDLDGKLKVLPNKYIQDIHHPNEYTIYNPNTGEMTKSSRIECVGLEKAAVWGAEDVEQRLCDYFEGRPNRLVEEYLIK